MNKQSYANPSHAMLVTQSAGESWDEKGLAFRLELSCCRNPQQPALVSDTENISIAVPLLCPLVEELARCSSAV